MRKLVIFLALALIAVGGWLTRAQWLPMQEAHVTGSFAAPIDGTPASTDGRASSAAGDASSSGSRTVASADNTSTSGNRASADSTSTAARDTSTPAGDTRASAANTSASAGDTRAPATNTSASAGDTRAPAGDARAAASPATTNTHPGSASTTVTANAAIASVQATQQQAEKFVATLTEAVPAPVTVERADHFVTGDQMLSLVPTKAVLDTTIDALIRDASLSLDTPITVVREVEQVERVTPEKLIAQSAGNLNATVQILRNNQIQETTVRKILENARRSPNAPIDIVTITEYFEQTTPRELAQIESGNTDQPIRIIRKHHGLEISSIADLMRAQEVKSGSLFYVRTVRVGDIQGIWGIVHDGIIDNFARGMAIRRGKEINTYQVDIPKDADERHADTSSSFLGKLIFNKSKASHVYNFKHNRMGRNPDRIYPNQEIVIIDFQPEELINIYKHFVAQRG